MYFYKYILIYFIIEVIIDGEFLVYNENIYL